jgi:hypothetical protein
MFHHIGLVAQTPKPGEMHYESHKVWGTDPGDDPNRVEWIRFAPDSPFADAPVARMPHLAWAVDDLDAELKGKQVVLGPIAIDRGVRLAHFMMDGALMEYLEFR